MTSSGCKRFKSAAAVRPQPACNFCGLCISYNSWLGPPVLLANLSEEVAPDTTELLGKGIQQHRDSGCGKRNISSTNLYRSKK